MSNSLKKIFNIIFYILFIISISINIVGTRYNILSNNTKIVKEMSESTQITDLNKNIETLNNSHTEYANYIETSKANLATAITNAGVATSGNDTFETMVNNVSNILSSSTSDGTATAAQILTGQTAYVKGSKVTGTMKNNEAVAPTALNAGESYTIPAGYHNGSGKVTAAALSGQTSGTATASQILKDKIAWVNGSKVTGTMTNRKAWTSTPTSSGKVTIPAGYHNGSGYVDTSSVYNKGLSTGQSNVKPIYLGTGTSFNVSSYEGYKNFTVNNNFIVCASKISTSISDGGGDLNGKIGGASYSATPTASYNASTGVLTISGLSGSANPSFTAYGCYRYCPMTTSISAPKVYLVPNGIS